MKKLFIAALALTAFTACSQDELVEQQQHPSGAIAFSGAFVDNATRAAQDPSTTAASINAFNVWAHIGKAGGVVFENQPVDKVNDAWTYSPLQYWIPGNTYYFAALSRAKDGNYSVALEEDDNSAKLGLGTVTFTNVDGTYDLIYAKDQMEAPQAGVEKKVDLTFEHLLSKVKFAFKNGFASDKNSIKVKNVKMTVPEKATINLAVTDYTNGWASHSGSKVLEFGSVNDENPLLVNTSAESAYERLTIPANQNTTYEVSFEVELYAGDVLAYSNALSTTITFDSNDKGLEMGKAYKFVATLDQSNIAGDELKPIEFDKIEVEGWGEPNEDNFGETTKVVGAKTADELVALLNLNPAAGKSAQPALKIRLLNDIDLSNVNVPLYVTDYYPSVTVDLNGKKITAGTFVADGNAGKTGEGTSDSYAFVVKSGELNITGSGEVYSQIAEYSIAVFAAGGKVNIYDGKYNNGSHGDLIYAKFDNTQVNIYGGEFIAALKKDNDPGTADMYPCLNINDSYRSEDKINVYGGKFHEFNPANCKAEGTGTNFVEEGYISIETAENVWEVKPENTLQSVTTAEGLQTALNAGGTNIVLANDITTETTLYAANNATLNLNGHSIKNTTTTGKTDVIIVKAGVELIINDVTNKAVVEAATNGDGYAVIADGTLTINGGTFKTGLDKDGYQNAVVYARGDANVTINGGIYQCADANITLKDSAEGDYRYTINKKDADNNTAIISVTGGQFYRFDPANNAAENPAQNFVASGYRSYAVDANWFAVVAE